MAHPTDGHSKVNGLKVKATALVATLAVAGGATDVLAAGQKKGGVPNSENGNGAPPQRETTAPAEQPAPADPGAPQATPAPTGPGNSDQVRVEGTGKVKVKLPGSEEMVDLASVGSLPAGAVIDATNGEATVRGQGDDWAAFSGGAFQVIPPGAGRVVTEIQLHGGNFAACRRGVPFGRIVSPLAAASASRKPVRKLWARGKGRFRTRGRNGSATVRGTVWLTADRCDGTLVKVKRGLVDVRDNRRKRTVPVRAGKKYLAKARR